MLAPTRGSYILFSALYALQRVWYYRGLNVRTALSAYTGPHFLGSFHCYSEFFFPLWLEFLPILPRGQFFSLFIFPRVKKLLLSSRFRRQKTRFFHACVLETIHFLLEYDEYSVQFWSGQKVLCWFWRRRIYWTVWDQKIWNQSISGLYFVHRR